MKKLTIYLILSRVLLMFLVIVVAATISSCDMLSGSGSGDQFEPNDTWQKAAKISLDTDYAATIADDSDIDFYSITTAHGSDTYDKVEFSLTNGSADLIFHFEVYSTSGEKLDEATADTAGQNFTYTMACPGGTYLFRVTGWDEVMHSDNGSQGAYTVRVSNLHVNDAQAPNHTIDTAAQVTFGTAYQGAIVSIYEDDWYKVNNVHSERWDRFELQITNVSSDLAAGYFILDADKNEIYGNHGVGGFPAGSDQYYSFASKSTILYFRVCGWDNIMGGPNGSSGTYTFKIVDENVNDNYEPDDTLAEAREIPLTATYPLSFSGTIVVDAANDNGGDYEWFKVNIPDSTTISWTADPQDNNTELHFNVYNPDGSFNFNVDGTDGETIGGNMTNNTGSASYFYIELGGYVDDTPGNYIINFTE